MQHSKGRSRTQCWRSRAVPTQGLASSTNGTDKNGSTVDVEQRAVQTNPLAESVRIGAGGGAMRYSSQGSVSHV